MDVLNVNHLLDPLLGAGTAERTVQMSRSLNRAGINCRILATDAGMTPEKMAALSDMKIQLLPCISDRFYIPGFSFKKIRRLVRKADIIHLMGHWTILNALVYFIARCLRKPYVVCPAGALLIYGRSKVLKKIYNRVVGKRILKNAAGYIAITQAEIQQFKVYGIDPDNITIIPNGIAAGEYVSTDDIGFRDRYGLGRDPILLFMGRLNPIKGPDLLLRAFAQASNQLQGVQLVFVGPDGGMLDELKQLADEFNIVDRVHFLGFLSGKAKAQAYHSAEFLVIPSRHEAMSNVALEAGITGTPVLLTDQCGFGQVSEIGGGLVVPASVEGLQYGLSMLWKERDRLKIMGENLKAFVSENYLWDSIINNLIKLYRRIL